MKMILQTTNEDNKKPLKEEVPKTTSMFSDDLFASGGQDKTKSSADDDLFAVSSSKSAKPSEDKKWICPGIRVVRS